MNTIDNGVKEVLGFDRIITNEELCFKVKIKDYYNREKILKVMRLKDIDSMREGEYTWTE